jgi:hypothetical protein
MESAASHEQLSAIHRVTLNFKLLYLQRIITNATVSPLGKACANSGLAVYFVLLNFAFFILQRIFS